MPEIYDISPGRGEREIEQWVAQSPGGGKGLKTANHNLISSLKLPRPLEEKASESFPSPKFLPERDIVMHGTGTDR